MPPIVLLAIAGAGFYAGYRLLTRRPQQAPVSKAEAERASGSKNLGELQWDAKTGVYRPKSGS